MLSPNSSARLRYLDWTRGFAALIMLQGHTFHSFTRMDLRDKGPYIFSQFLGGLAPAIFLFLTGVTMAFRMDSDERRGLEPGARVLSAPNRGLGLAPRTQQAPTHPSSQSRRTRLRRVSSPHFNNWGVEQQAICVSAAWTDPRLFDRRLHTSLQVEQHGELNVTCRAMGPVRELHLNDSLQPMRR